MIAPTLPLPRSNKRNVAASKVPVIYKISSRPLSARAHTHFLMPRLKECARLEIIHTYIQKPSPGPTPLFGALVLPVMATCVSSAASSYPWSGNTGSPRLSPQASVLLYPQLNPRWPHLILELKLPSILWLPSVPFWLAPCPWTPDTYI